MVHPVSQSPRGPRAGQLSASVARADSRAHARRAAVSGTAAAHGDGGGGIHRRTGRGAAARDGLQAIGTADEADRGAAARRHGAAGHHRRRRRADRHVDHVVRALRLSRVARGQLRAAGLCERVPQGALSGGVLHGAAQQPADGVLPPVDAGQGRAAARRPLSPDRRAGVRLGLHGRGRRRHPAGPALCERPARTGRPRDRRSSESPHRQRGRTPAAPATATCRCCCPKCGCDDDRCSSAPTTAGCSATSARTTGPRRAAARARPRTLRVARRSRRAHRAAPRRARHARRHRRAEHVRLRPPLGALAGGAGGAARG